MKPREMERHHDGHAAARITIGVVLIGASLLYARALNRGDVPLSVSVAFAAGLVLGFLANSWLARNK